MSNEVLLLEDLLEDIVLFREVFKDLNLDISLSIIREYKDIQPFIALNGLPSLIILDLNLGAKDGRDIIKALRREYGNGLPIVVFSSSELNSDVIAFYNAGASAYNKKPSRYDELISAIHSMVSYWSRVKRGSVE